MIVDANFTEIFQLSNVVFSFSFFVKKLKKHFMKN